MERRPLTREEMIRVIEGRGCAHRVPVLVHCWVSPSIYQGETRLAAQLDEAFTYGQNQ